ncbi:hypothetical protein PC115_g452 [Phytophthora cactorum]|uniref:Uncharacterized protein n=1 Tax=Phytophthora cactorum TaxID=29920 RepID=A0A8T1DX46_9STRA|nr:hypothetical protein PC115_g452 [Phytophthora cactorum]
MTYRELQATRVLSVDAYWQELREPSRRTPREIPVPLWPGESLQQYEREFGRWLAARRLSLVSMREDPVTERNYRLQFAQTRVARPAQQRHPSGPRSRSRSRSPSRSPPHKRRFIGAQQHPIQREDRGYVYGRKPSPDTGRLIAARQTAVRLVPERNYPRDRPQVTRGYSAAPEASRVHDNWQAQRGVEPRPRQDTRPSPRAAHRQYVGDAQRWTRSPSPEYYSNRAVSPQRSDRSFSSQVRRSASPHDQARSNVDILRKQLLARRVISVDAFRDEMYKLRNGIIREDALKRPLETMRAIVVAHFRVYEGGSVRFGRTSSFQRSIAIAINKNESSSCSQYAFGGSSQGSKSEFGVNNYGAFGKNDNYVLSSQIRSFLNRFRSRDHSCSSTTVKLSDSPIARGTKNKT